MAAIVNGLSLSSAGVRRDLLHLQRLRAARHAAAALMELPTHLRVHATTTPWVTAEDGPTPPAGEHLASLRASRARHAAARGRPTRWWRRNRYVMQLRHQPAVLALSRQPLPTLDRRSYAPATGVARGPTCSRTRRAGIPR